MQDTHAGAKEGGPTADAQPHLHDQDETVTIRRVRPDGGEVPAIVSRIVEIEQLLGFSFESAHCDGNPDDYLDGGVRKYRCQAPAAEGWAWVMTGPEPPATAGFGEWGTFEVDPFHAYLFKHESLAGVVTPSGGELGGMVQVEGIETVADLEDHLVDEVLAAERAYVADDTDGGDSPPVRTDGGTPRRQAPPLNWDTVTRFQVDLLLAAASAGPCKGLRLKRELERYYDDGVNHGRLYPNLNDLAERDVLEKRPHEPDERSNQYTITPAGRDLLEARQQTISRALSFTGADHLSSFDGDAGTAAQDEEVSADD